VLRRASFDQSCSDLYRIVVGPGQIIDCARDRLMEAIGQFRNLGDPYRASVEVFDALIEDPLEHESHCDAARRHRGSHTPSRRYRQFKQGIQTAKPAALRLIKELTLEMGRRQIDYRFRQLKSRRVNKASKLIPASRKLSAAPSNRSTTDMTFSTVHSYCRA